MTKLFLMIGLPASGKSTLAEQIAKSEDAEIVSSDNIRKELYGEDGTRTVYNVYEMKTYREIIIKYLEYYKKE